MGNDVAQALCLARAMTPQGARVVLVDPSEGPPGQAGGRLATVGGQGFADLPALLEAAGGELGAVAAGAAVAIGGPQGLLSVVGAPRKVVCVGLNYRTHIAEGGRPAPAHPELFPKFATSLAAPYADISLPLATSRVDWESEAAFVISRRCRHVAAADAASVVLGYTAANDVSVRDYQAHASQWMAGKAWDASAPLGPVLKPAGQCGGMRFDLALTGRLNGEVVQHSRTSDLLFGAPELVEYITSFMTLEAGDVVLTGTPGGVGAAMKPPRFLKPADVFEVELEGVGTLRNTFRQAD